MRLIYFGLAWVLGIYLGMRYEFHWIALAVILGTSLLSAVLFHRKKPLLLGALCLALLFGGILRSQSPAGDPLEAYRGFHEIRGIVAADPEARDRFTVLRFKVTEIVVNGEWQDISGMAQVYAPPFPAGLTEWRDAPYYRYGDLLEMGGVLKSPQPPEEGEEFDFRAYLARQGIYAVIYPKGVKLLASGQKSKLMELIYRLRGGISQALDRAMPEPPCSFAKAMLLGQRTSIPPEVKQAFSRTGTAHLLAISGLHVGIVAGIALGAGVLIFGRHRPYYVLLALALVWLYVILSGMHASAIRAAIMGSLWLYADWIGRPHSAFTALTFAAAIMLGFNPLLLTHIGFQLSFAAMAGLITLAPIFHNWSKRRLGGKGLSPAINFVIGTCSVTLGAVLATLPLIAYYFHLIPLISLPANFFTLPAIPGAIVTAALTGVAGLFLPDLATLMGWISWLFITYVLKAVDVFATIPFASLSGEVDTLAVCTYYGGLAAVLWMPRNWRKLAQGTSKMKDYFITLAKVAAVKIPTKWIILPLLVLAALVWSMVLTTPDSRLHIFFFDVGQGDSILIQQGTQQILIDGGPSPEKVTNQLGAAMPFWDRTIELVVLTHPESDHLTGLAEVLQRYEVKRVLTSGQKGNSGAYIEWRKLVGEQGIERVAARKGQVIVIKGDVELKILHPTAKSSGQTDFDINNSSIVMRLTDGNFSCLLTGDIEVEAEEFLLEQDVRLRSTVLKVAHHGSSTSTTARFLSEVKPMVAVVSVGRDNPFGHPGEKVLARLEETVRDNLLFCTSEDGTVELITDGQKLWIEVGAN